MNEVGTWKRIILYHECCYSDEDVSWFLAFAILLQILNFLKFRHINKTEKQATLSPITVRMMFTMSLETGGWRCVLAGVWVATAMQCGGW